MFQILVYVQEEYEAARAELIQEVARGTTVEKLREKLTKNTQEPAESIVLGEKIPNELVQVQAYIRWEKAGKPNYSQEQQLVRTSILLGLIPSILLESWKFESYKLRLLDNMLNP